MKNIHAPIVGFPLLVLASFAAGSGCSHPATGGSTTGVGGNNTPTGVGGGGTPVQGVGGNGGTPVVNGTGGAVVLPPPDGTGGMTTAKMSCTPTSFSSTLTYSPGYPGHTANLTQAQAMLSNLSPTEKTQQMAGSDPVKIAKVTHWMNEEGLVLIALEWIRSFPKELVTNAYLFF